MKFQNPLPVKWLSDISYPLLNIHRFVWILKIFNLETLKPHITQKFWARIPMTNPNTMNYKMNKKLIIISLFQRFSTFERFRFGRCQIVNLWIDRLLWTWFEQNPIFTVKNHLTVLLIRIFIISIISQSKCSLETLNISNTWLWTHWLNYSVLNHFIVLS